MLLAYYYFRKLRNLPNQQIAETLFVCLFVWKLECLAHGVTRCHGRSTNLTGHNVRNSDKLKNPAVPNSGEVFSLSTGAA